VGHPPATILVKTAHMSASSSSSSLGVTDILAIWGAVLSSVAFGWNLYRDLLDRGKLKISAHIRRLAWGEDGKPYSVKHDLPVEGASAQPYVVITAISTGRRPVMLKGWGGHWHKPVNGKRTFVVVGRDLPKMLKEGEFHSEYTNELVSSIDNLKNLCVWDASGEEWRVPRSELKKLKEDASVLGDGGNDDVRRQICGTQR